jgi:hypothetical protein
MPTPQGYYDLLEQLERSNCAICTLVLHAEKQYRESLLYEFSLDGGVHRAFRQGRGLCNHHSWQLVHQHGYSLSVAALFKSALDEVVKMMQSPTLGTSASRVNQWLHRSHDDQLADRLEPEAPCMMCVNVQEAEDRYVQTFAKCWSEEALQTAFRASDGLCLPHLRQVLRRLDTARARRQLVDIQLAKWTALQGQLAQFQIKSAFNYVGEPMGAEADSWKRAVASLTGGEAAVPRLTRPK